MSSTHTCAVNTSGQVLCWGAKSTSSGLTTEVSTATPVAGLPGPATSVGAGLFGGSCALLANGQVMCRGENWYGRLGNGTTTYSASPVTVSGLTGVSQISVSSDGACALLANGEVRCWGVNYNGQLGADPYDYSAIPVAVAGLSGVVRLAVGSPSSHSSAVLVGNSVKCWGGNVFREIPGESASVVPTPVTVAGLSGVTQVSRSGRGTQMVVGEGKVVYWGWSQY